MAQFLKLVATLGVKAAKWAWAHKDRVMQWLKDGMSFSWIKDQIEKYM